MAVKSASVKAQDLADVQVRIWCDSKTNSIVWMEEDEIILCGMILFLYCRMMMLCVFRHLKDIDIQVLIFIFRRKDLWTARQKK